MTNSVTKKIPMSGLVVLVGPSGAGKSTFCEKHFHPHEVVSTDAIRQELTGDFRRQDRNDLMFDEFHRRIVWKLQAGCRVVADATHIRDGDRKRTAQIGLDLGVPVVYVVINRSLPAKMSSAGWRETVRTNGRPLVEADDETFLANEKKILAGDNLWGVTVIDTRTDTFEAVRPLPRDPKLVLTNLVARGFDTIRVIGDVHGNLEGLVKATPPSDSKVFYLFLGDIVDYGVKTLETANDVAYLVANGLAANLRGNHERKVLNFVLQERQNGFRGQETHGNNITFNRLRAMQPDDRLAWETRFIGLVENSPDHIVITTGDDRTYGFVHAAMMPRMFTNLNYRFDRNSREESFALYGETDGTTGPDGFPTRLYNWIDDLPDRHTALVGHAIRSTEEPLRVRNSQGGEAIFLDTGSSKGGKLSWMDFRIEAGRKGAFVLREEGIHSE